MKIINKIQVSSDQYDLSIIAITISNIHFYKKKKKNVLDEYFARIKNVIIFN